MTRSYEGHDASIYVLFRVYRASPKKRVLQNEELIRVLRSIEEVAYLLSKTSPRTNTCQNMDYRHPTTYVGDCSVVFMSMMDLTHKLHHIRKTSYLILDHINNLLVQNCDLAGISWRGGGLGSSTIFKNLMSPTPRRKWYLTTGRRAH